MIDIAIDVVRKIEQKKGPYYVHKLTSVFFYLIKFENAKVNSVIEKYTTHKEYLIAYNAKRALQDSAIS
jgi:hypothetical protein